MKYKGKVTATGLVLYLFSSNLSHETRNIFKSSCHPSTFLLCVPVVLVTPQTCEVQNRGALTAAPSLPLCSRWFHGKITRDQAERLLSPPETGLFLVRESTNFPGDYTLCVSCDGKVEHYRIIYHDGKLTIDDEVYFENLMQLVEVCSFFVCLYEIK